MPGLIIGGREVPVPGLTVLNWNDDPVLKLRVGQPDGNNDGKLRRKPVSIVVAHTTRGIPGGKDKREQDIRPGVGPSAGTAARVARFWSTSDTPSGAHLVVDFDRTVACLADLQTVCAYHAGNSEVNERSIGIEIAQGPDAELYEGQLGAVVELIDVITALFGIQRQIPRAYTGRPLRRLEAGGRDVVGVVGHRDVTDNRGKGDPGDAIMAKLAEAGYEAFDFANREDLGRWTARQTEIRTKLGRQLAIDGIPGPATVAALKELGYQHGLWTMPPVQTHRGTAIGSILDAFYPTFFGLADGNPGIVLTEVEQWLDRKRRELA